MVQVLGAGQEEIMPIFKEMDDWKDIAKNKDHLKTHILSVRAT